MKMSGEQRVAAPRQKVWEALNDPEVLRASIPGCQSLEKVSDERFDATVEVKVGPIGARFKGSVALTNLNPPNQYTLLLEGNGGIAGSMKGRAEVKLLEQDGVTVVAYEVEAQVGGRMAQLGGPVIDATAKQLAGRFFARFGECVAPTPKAAATAASGAVPSLRPAARAVGGSSPVAWLLVAILAAAVGFMAGRGGVTPPSDWAGLAIGLLLIVVAGGAFEYGRRSATPVTVLDASLLRRLLEDSGK
jgi:carbon monoxide dehydrogenase subunit G